MKALWLSSAVLLLLLGLGMSDILDTPILDLTKKENMEGEMPEINLVAKHQHA